MVRPSSDFSAGLFCTKWLFLEEKLVGLTVPTARSYFIYVYINTQASDTSVWGNEGRDTDLWSLMLKNTCIASMNNNCNT